MPHTGDTLVSNRRLPIVTIREDDSPGVHDTVIACCDWPRYRRLGCADYHDNCADNLRMALEAIGVQAPHVPDPFNLWMNIPIAPERRHFMGAAARRASAFCFMPRWISSP